MARACFHFVKLFIEKGRTRIKVEVNHVFRGTLLPVEPRRDASDPVEACQARTLGSHES